jgi:hemolysin D
MRRTLFEHETGSKLLYLQTVQQLVEQQQDLNIQKSHYREADAAVAAVTETRAQTAAEYRRAPFDDLGNAETKAADGSEGPQLASSKDNRFLNR